MGFPAMNRAFRNRAKRNDLQVQIPLPSRMCGIMDGIPTLQMVKVLDLTLRGALVEHERLFQPASPCFLQLGINGDLAAIRCRIAHSRVSPNSPQEDQHYQTVLEFRNLTPVGEHILKALIQLLWAHTGSAGGP